ncbi:hypothetical protein BJ166DRAFT_523382 [Pestalotiopsis sp. NC0098]|nr:hypothetical protein BJ166DRAFT_523382 [Pestalotiopsis sp. NC0098]
MPGSPALGRIQQYVEHESPSSPLTTSPSTSKSGESIAARTKTPQSSLPSPGLPPKSLAQIMMESPGMPLRSRTFMSKSVPARSLQDGENDDRNKVPSPSQTCSNIRMSNSEAVTSLERGVRGQSNPKLREENDKYRQKKSKGSGRGDIQSKVSHIIAQTKIKSINGIGSQSGSTRNLPLQSLTTGVSHNPQALVHGALDQSPDSDDASEACSLPPLLEIGRRQPGHASSGDGTATRNLPKDLHSTPGLETGISDGHGSRSTVSTSRRNGGTRQDIEPVSMPTLTKRHEAQNRPSPVVAASDITLRTGAPSTPRTPSNQRMKNPQVMVSETKRKRRRENRRQSRNAKGGCDLSIGGPVRTPTMCAPLAQSPRKRKASSLHGEDAPTPCISPDSSSKKRKGIVHDQDAQPDQVRVDTRGLEVASSSQSHLQGQDICAAVVKQMVIRTLNEVFGFDGKDAPEVFRRNLREMIGNGSE